ncbi:uncharacterized protein K02A2.6-like [Ornithodoros turicata]|uniref:uncharacterized protein K02A2.6-like n=1 Tax=Ornithodoros turicata TaxID=34597 RepID=UPI0031394B57
MLAKECNFGSIPETTQTTPTTSAQTTAPPVMVPTASSLSTTTASTSESVTRLPLDIRLRNRFVCGLRDTYLQQRLLTERHLTFRLAFDMAKAAEAAAQQQAELRGHAQEGAVHFMHKNQGKQDPAKGGSHDGSKKKDQKLCFRCAAWFGKKKAQQKAAKNHHMDNADPDSEEEMLYDLHRVHSITNVESFPRFSVDLKVQGKRLAFEVDSGSAFTLISEKTFRLPWPHHPLKLRQGCVQLHTWSGEGLQLAGACDVRVRWKSKDYLLPLLVVKGTGCNLMGRNWFRPLRITFKGISNVEQLDRLTDVVNKHSAVFSDTIEGHIGPPVDLELKDEATPQFQKARPVPFALRSAVEKELEKWEKQGIIEPVQHADWATPVVTVRKKNGSLRFCGDYRSTVNQTTKKASYPLSAATEVLAGLQGGKFFSTLDLAQAYQQLRVTPRTAHILTLNTVKGLYAVKRLPFGVAAVPAVSQRYMETLLAGIEGTSVYLDDEIVSGSTRDEHDDRLELVLDRLQKANLRLRKEMCQFAVREVSFLGHRINAEGIHTSEDKIKALVEAPEPTNKTELQSFLGLLAFYDRFIPNRASIARELYALLNKNCRSTWQECHRAAYANLKSLISKRTVFHFAHSNVTEAMCPNLFHTKPKISRPGCCANLICSRRLQREG